MTKEKQRKDRMKYYFAPMEGITGHIYRRAHGAIFKPADKYFTPFLSPNQKRTFNSREKNDVLPEHNEGIFVVPQILTNNSGDFLHTCGLLWELGYEEVNLNLGCPSGTVASKQRGSGFLGVPEKLDVFLEEVFAKAPVQISIKTRLGVEEPEEFYRLLEIYEKYPVSELIVHPRVRQDFYKNTPRREIFREALKESRHSLCYNGDLFTPRDMESFQKEFPQVDAVMLGRGFLTNPAFLNCMEQSSLTGEMLKKALKAFHDRVCGEYQELLSGDKNVLFKMKELWFYMIRLFPDCGKLEKQIKKAQRLTEYEQTVEEIFSERELVIPDKLYF